MLLIEPEKPDNKQPTGKPAPKVKEPEPEPEEDADMGLGLFD